MSRKGRDNSCRPPERVFQEFALSVVTAEEMRAEGDAKGLVDMLVNHNPALSKRDSEMGGLDLKDETLEGNGVVVTDGALLLDGEDQIKIDVSLDRDKGRSGLLGFDREALVKLADVDIL